MHAKSDALRGLYAITPSNLRGEALLAAVEAALEGGARIVQYRDKKAAPDRKRADAEALARLCARHGACFLINDDPELAAVCDAHGVHLGRDDPSPSRARARLGPEAIIGVSCYDQWSRATAAVRAGADYVAFGAFHPSSTKPTAVRAHPELLRRARRELGVPVVAIGGITAENALPLIEAGADMVAVVQGLFAQPDVRAAARRISQLFEPSRGPS